VHDSTEQTDKFILISEVTALAAHRTGIGFIGSVADLLRFCKSPAWVSPL
jgi:hypothetical protein